MARLEVVVCDECGRQKGETNHWFVAMNWKMGPFKLLPAADADFTPDIDLCSEGCAVKALQKWLKEVGNADVAGVGNGAAAGGSDVDHAAVTFSGNRAV